MNYVPTPLSPAFLGPRTDTGILGEQAVKTLPSGSNCLHPQDVYLSDCTSLLLQSGKAGQDFEVLLLANQWQSWAPG